MLAAILSWGVSRDAPCHDLAFVTCVYLRLAFGPALRYVIVSTLRVCATRHRRHCGLKTTWSHRDGARKKQRTFADRIAILGLSWDSLRTWFQNRGIEEHLVKANIVLDKMQAAYLPIWIVSIDFRIDWASLWPALRGQRVSEHLTWLLQIMYHNQKRRRVRRFQHKRLV